MPAPLGRGSVYPASPEVSSRDAIAAAQVAANDTPGAYGLVPQTYDGLRADRSPTSGAPSNPGAGYFAAKL